MLHTAFLLFRGVNPYDKSSLLSSLRNLSRENSVCKSVDSFINFPLIIVPKDTKDSHNLKKQFSKNDGAKKAGK